ncbi:hypothetical protein SLE2022_022320 [Rubroshorea leprosula]
MCLGQVVICFQRNTPSILTYPLGPLPPSLQMANCSSQAHICQCLSRLATAKRNSIVAISDSCRKTGQQFIGSVLTLATGLLQLGLRNGDVVAIST